MLGRVPIFQHMRKSVVADLRSRADEVTFVRGQSIAVAGKRSSGLTIILEGSVLRAGLEMSVGDWFDEYAALDHISATESATAIDEGRCLVLTAGAVHAAVRSNSELGVWLLRSIANRPLAGRELDDEQLMKYAVDLRENFRISEKRCTELQESVIEVVRGLVRLAESKHLWMAGHGHQAARVARLLAEELGYDAEFSNTAVLAALLHDVGLVIVDESILAKRGPLTPDEQAKIQAHPEVGAHIIEEFSSLKGIVPFILHHHERIDGRGFPKGLHSRSIPLAGRFMAIVEAYTTLRLQNGVVSRGDMQKRAGTELDRDITMILCRMIDANRFATSPG